MKPADRQQWILKYLRARSGSYAYRVNVLDRYFVDAYIEATGAKADGMPFGADKCPQLGRDLSEMFKAGQLQRSRTGIQGMGGMGFPRWVWEYTL